MSLLIITIYLSLTFIVIQLKNIVKDIIDKRNYLFITNIKLICIVCECVFDKYVLKTCLKLEVNWRNNLGKILYVKFKNIVLRKAHLKFYI